MPPSRGENHTVQVCSQTPQNVQSVALSDDPLKLMVQGLKEGHTIQIRPPGHHSGECSGGIEGASCAAVPLTGPTSPISIHTQLPVPQHFQRADANPVRAPTTISVPTGAISAHTELPVPKLFQKEGQQLDQGKDSTYYNYRALFQFTQFTQIA